MAVVTLRLNTEEVRALGFLVKHFEVDQSKILKAALWEKFEELRDRELIEVFEKKSAAKKVQFASADALIKRINKASKPQTR